MHCCKQCGGEVDRTHRFCPWCAAPQRVKVVEFFPAHPEVDADEGKALRVTRYLGDDPASRHVRFSVWDESGTAVGAVSLEEIEASRLAAFLKDARLTRRSFLEQLRLTRRV